MNSPGGMVLMLQMMNQSLHSHLSCFCAVSDLRVLWRTVRTPTVVEIGMTGWCQSVEAWKWNLVWDARYRYTDQALDFWWTPPSFWMYKHQNIHGIPCARLMWMTVDEGEEEGRKDLWFQTWYHMKNLNEFKQHQSNNASSLINTSQWPWRRNTSSLMWNFE